jgi:WhiB family redox-sensing transcriptional regulator
MTIPDIGIFTFPDMKEMEWRKDANCRNADVKTQKEFFPTTADGKVGDFAKSLCATCEVQNPCLDWAIKHGESGYWGGASEKDRRKIRRERRRRAS